MRTSFPRAATAWAIMVLTLAGCGNEATSVVAQGGGQAGSNKAAGSAAVRVTASGDCVVKYGRPRSLGKVDDKRISESSGIARSLLREGSFWTHNDGDSPRLYCVDKEGETLAVVKLEGAEFVDCEDIAAFTRGGMNYLLYADTGDNEFKRSEYRLHLFEEPQPMENAPGKAKGKGKGKGKGKAKPQDVSVTMTIPFRFPDGPTDCEAVAVDPTSGKVYLATKEESRGSRVYELDLPANTPARPLEARLVARLEMRSVAAMDISADGRRAVVLTDTAAFLFARGPDEGWPAAFKRQPCLVPTPPRKNGESICFGSDGRTLYLSSEGDREPLWEIPAE
jgi:hypothetical protein